MVPCWLGSSQNHNFWDKCLFGNLLCCYQLSSFVNTRKSCGFVKAKGFIIFFWECRMCVPSCEKKITFCHLVLSLITWGGDLCCNSPIYFIILFKQVNSFMPIRDSFPRSNVYFPSRNESLLHKLQSFFIKWGFLEGWKLHKGSNLNQDSFISVKQRKDCTCSHTVYSQDEGY